ncbi:MAG: hypothetical protein E6J83_16535 [Deltaproteobacteria bacterium]|nr:MAG: hypothetical protein E6J83_16535 [Deltaproteobacteria bacterium]
MTMADDLIRIQFEMTKEKVRDLDHLMAATSMRSRRELFDNALKRARRNQLPLSQSAGRSDEEQFEPHTVEGAPKPKHKEA